MFPVVVQVNPRGPGGHTCRTYPVQALQRLLLDRLNLDWHELRAPGRLDQGGRIGSVSLIALDVGPHIPGRQQLDLDTALLKQPTPVVGRSAGLHDHQAHAPVVKPAFKLAAGKPRTLHDAPVLIGHGQLEHTLCQIHRHSRSIHIGLLPGCADTHTT